MQPEALIMSLEKHLTKKSVMKTRLGNLFYLLQLGLFFAASVGLLAQTQTNISPSSVEVSACGYNYFGVLGTQIPDPAIYKLQKVNFPPTQAWIKQLKAGYKHTTALLDNGTVLIWGETGMSSNPYITSVITVPQSVPNFKAKKIVDGLYRSYAIGANGGVYALCLNDSTLKPEAVVIMDPGSSFASDIIDIALCGWDCTIVLKRDGTVWGWGSNYVGELGCGKMQPLYSEIPLQVQSGTLASGVKGALKDVVAIASNGNAGHVVALKKDGTVWTWGVNMLGSLGIGVDNYQEVPYAVQVLESPGFPLRHVVSISVGAEHSVALKNSGSVFSWGNNWIGQLGDGTTAYKIYASRVSKLYNVVKIASGCFHNLAVTLDNRVYVWGGCPGISSGQLGLGSVGQSLTPSLLQTFPVNQTVEIAPGDFHTEISANLP